MNKRNTFLPKCDSVYPEGEKYFAKKLSGIFYQVTRSHIPEVGNLSRNQVLFCQGDNRYCSFLTQNFSSFFSPLDVTHSNPLISHTGVVYPEK
jgi:hypothetical protein